MKPLILSTSLTLGSFQSKCSLSYGTSSLSSLNITESLNGDTLRLKLLKNGSSEEWTLSPSIQNSNTITVGELLISSNSSLFLPSLMEILKFSWKTFREHKDGSLKQNYICQISLGRWLENLTFKLLTNSTSSCGRSSPKRRKGFTRLDSTISYEIVLPQKKYLVS